MKKNIAKNYFRKIVAAMFCLAMLVYGQCGYAIIEKYLVPVEGNLYKLGTKFVPVRINTMELAMEVATCIRRGELCEIHIQDIDQENIRQLILEALVEALQNNEGLTLLDLRGNHLGDTEVQFLAKALRNNTILDRLYLGYNQVGIEGVHALAEALKINTVLSTLDLRGNEIGIEGVQAIVEALQFNIALTTLYLGENQIEVEGVQSLAEALQINTVLSTLDPYSYRIGSGSERTTTVDKILLRNNLLIKLLRKIKYASTFTFEIGFRLTPLRYVLPNILRVAGLDVHNRSSFGNVQNYNNERIRDIIFRGRLEDIIRLFYYGNNVDYREILGEVNQVRRLQIEIFLELNHRIPEGLLELPEDLPINTFLLNQGDGEQRRNLVQAIFWTG